MPRLDTSAQITALLGKALDTGQAERLSVTQWRWDVSGRCASPVYVQRVGRPAAEFGKRYVLIDASGKLGHATPIPLGVEIVAPCRKCEHCLRQRQRLWVNRAKDEIGRSARTWFGTLTIRPQRRFEYLNLARHNCAARGDNFELLNHEQQFFEIHHCVMRDVTLFLKRLRKSSGANVRYMLVTERHKSGDPHLHLFVHEPHIGDSIRKVELERCWHEGFSHWRLVVADAQDRVRYLTKYIAKEKLTRIRASLHYGRASDDAEASLPALRLPSKRASKAQKANDLTQRQSAEDLSTRKMGDRQ